MEENDDCIIVSHEMDKGFTPEESKSFRKTLDNKKHSLTGIKNNVLPLWSRLDDDSLDEFLRIVRTKYGFETQSVKYMYSHPTLVEPVQSTCSVQLIGGNRTDPWRCLAFDGSRLCVYDSLPNGKYGLVNEENFIYATAFATSVVLGRDSCKERYSNDEVLMRRHFVRIIEDESLALFLQD